MARRGALVAIADIAFDRARELAEGLPGALAIALDLEQADSIEAMIAQTVAHFGRLDVLHNNAALLGPEIAQQDGDIEHMATALWDRTYAVNVRGTMIGCRAALPHLRETGGNIVNTVSNLALQGHIIQAAYSSSKAAIIQMTRAIAASHGIHGVRCNAVAPGMTMTPALREAFPLPLRAAVEGKPCAPNWARPRILPRRSPSSPAMPRGISRVRCWWPMAAVPAMCRALPPSVLSFREKTIEQLRHRGDGRGP
jgi:NAD(P)-dependent dehydrogenase (short-subunit alcohol dehydrogenase family)